LAAATAAAATAAAAAAAAAAAVAAMLPAAVVDADPVYTAVKADQKRIPLCEWFLE